MRGVDIYDLSINLGTMVNYIEKTYSHITFYDEDKELTKGLGYWKDREIREKLVKLSNGRLLWRMDISTTQRS